MEELRQLNFMHKLDEIMAYALTQKEKARKTRNKGMEEMADHLIFVLKEWAAERIESKKFYAGLKNLG